MSSSIGLRAPDLFAPFRLDIDMTGGAGAGAAAIGIDAGDQVFDGGFHDRHAGRALDGLFGAVMLYVSDLYHRSRRIRSEFRTLHRGSGKGKHNGSGRTAILRGRSMA